MADPVSMTAVSMAASAGKAGLGVFSALSKGKADQQMYQYQAAVARVNKQIAEQNADYAVAAGEVEAQQSGMKSRAQLGSARAKQGASGLDVNRGSAVKVRESIADIGAHNTAIVRNNAARKAYAYKVEGMQQEAQAKIYDASASQAKKAGTINAIGSILGGISDISGKWMGAKQAGVFAMADTNPVDVGSAISWEK